MTATTTFNTSAEDMQRLKAYLASPEGQAGLRDALARADEAIAQLQKARAIDPALLRTPFGPLHTKPLI